MSNVGIYYITTNTSKDPYWRVNPITGTKRKVSSAEWGALRKAHPGGEIRLVTVTKAVLDRHPNG